MPMFNYSQKPPVDRLICSVVLKIAFLNPGLIKTLDNKIWDDLPFCNCNLSIEWIENQTSFDSDISNSGNKLKIGKCILFI